MNFSYLDNQITAAGVKTLNPVASIAELTGDARKFDANQHVCIGACTNHSHPAVQEIFQEAGAAIRAAVQNISGAAR